jgi:hypothetical protein
MISFRLSWRSDRIAPRMPVSSHGPHSGTGTICVRICDFPHQISLMRRFLILLEGATIGIVVAYGVVGQWRDWKMSQSPEAVVEQFEILPASQPNGLGI